jgi:hypothetical protein
MIYLLLLPPVLWLFYLASMNLIANKDKVIKPVKYLGAIVVLIGIVLDVLFNWIWMTVLLLEVPQEWLTTARLKRHQITLGWKGNISRWMCKHLLSPFDATGDHCD